MGFRNVPSNEVDADDPDYPMRKWDKHVEQNPGHVGTLTGNQIACQNCNIKVTLDKDKKPKQRTKDQSGFDVPVGHPQPHPDPTA